MQTFTHPSLGTIGATTAEDKVYVVKKNAEKLLGWNINDVDVEEVTIEGQRCIAVEDYLSFIDRENLLKWILHEVYPHVTEENEPESLWRRFVVTGTLEEIRELTKMLNDKKLCHEEIAMILTMMRFRKEE